MFWPVNQRGFASASAALAVALATILNAVARELDVLAGRRRVEGREARPLAALAQRLEPVHAQAVRERSLRPAVEIRADLRVGGGVDPELLLPVLDVRREDVAGELRRQRIEAKPVAALEGRARREEIRVALREGGGRGKSAEDERQE